MRTTSGFLLAATVAEDDASATARGGLVRSLAEHVAPEAEALANRPADERRAIIRRHASTLRGPARADAPSVPRARALLAPEMPRDVGRVWLAAAPKPRRGYVAPAALRDVLRRVTREARPADPQLAHRERGAGRDLIARHLRDTSEQERAAVLDSLGAEEAGAVLALESLLGAESADLDASAIAAIVRATRSRPAIAPDDRTRAAGAMALGWLGGDGDDGGDALSRPFWRAGRELRELMEAGCRA